MSGLEKTWEVTPDLTEEQTTLLLAMLDSLAVDTPPPSETDISEDKPDLAADQMDWLSSMFESLEADTLDAEALDPIAQNLTPAGRRILLDPANINPTPPVYDMATALHTLRTDMRTTSVAGLQVLAARHGRHTHFARRLRLEGTRTGPNTPFQRRPDHTIQVPMGIPEVRCLHDLLRDYFPLISEFELALGPAGVPFTDIINPGDVPKCLFRMLNSLQRRITHLSLVSEADDWNIETPGKFYVPRLQDCVLEDLEELRVQWPYFVDDRMACPPRAAPHPWLKFYKRIFKSPLRTLVLEGRGQHCVFPPVGPTFNAIPVGGCNLRNLMLTNLVLTDYDMCILIPKLPKLESITLDKIQFEGDWPQVLRMLADLCLCLEKFKFQEVMWALDRHHRHNGKNDYNPARMDNVVSITLSGSSEEVDIHRGLRQLASFGETLRCRADSTL
ncbi:hypothetical protein ASPACDRAFT_48414 [Aspergillus aculeatus ATCC 16872]|uniref:Uncharacterized protein n=1 Tax=Aspergillus aculeatus (strain ATCC 16872 / CBS 172.66 / WB 5094) TaxID=690307 RepID=A0A1L9WFM1_ASPA1|nr:uncharacterized protein ASPACDRAFT_48414 [Aspergillus aculeatus ATCC 16872]OJJ94968.1 hypothetical protein ASPACDRAFT_48414 [Aspergillus aculeatus ATCC 16872]